MGEFWINRQNELMLSGTQEDHSDPMDFSDPVKLPAGFILDFLTNMQEARDSYLRVKHLLTDAEITRVEPIYQTALKLSGKDDPVQMSDRFQSRLNLGSKVRTVGKYGGTRRGGNS